KRDVKDGSDDDLTQEPEMIRAFRDTWELGIHSYLTYLRDRLLLAKELLHESGSYFVQISDENLHHVRELMDDVFGANNLTAIVDSIYSCGHESYGARRRMTSDEAQNPRLVPNGCRIFLIDNLTSTGWSESLSRPVRFDGEEFALGPNLHWKTTPQGMHNLIA